MKKIFQKIIVSIVTVCTMFALTSCKALEAVIAVPLLLVYSILTLPDKFYFIEIGWSEEDHDVFSTTYLELYEAKLNTLKAQYGLNCEMKKTVEIFTIIWYYI